MEQYKIIPVSGHYEVYHKGKFVCSVDSRSEAKKEIEEREKMINVGLMNFWESGEVVKYLCAPNECVLCDEIARELPTMAFEELCKDEELFDHVKQLYDYVRR